MYRKLESIKAVVNISEMVLQVQLISQSHILCNIWETCKKLSSS